MASRLAGLAVLVTRPRERAGSLIDALAAAGAEPIPFPTIEIEPIPAARAIDPMAFDLLIFVSPAAVEHAATRLEDDWPRAIAAVGDATARALCAQGRTPTVLPVGANNSEGLLAHAALAADAVAGQRVLIVRGEGGRDLLARTLVARGATVDYAEVYRRVRPVGNETGRVAASDLVLVTSNEGVTNLLSMLDTDTRKRLLGRPLVVASGRTARHAAGLGFHGPIAVADGADDPSLMAAAEQLVNSSSQGQTGPV